MTKNQPNNTNHQYHQTTINDENNNEQEYRQFYQHQYQLPHSETDQVNITSNQSTYVNIMFLFNCLIFILLTYHFILY